MALGCAAALGPAAALVAMPGAAVGLATTARHGLTSLPAAAQGPISAALGRDEPTYHLTGFQAVNPAQRLRAGFSRGGVTVAAGAARLGITLSAYGYASALRPLGSVAPLVSANRVSYAHGSLTEWYVNGPFGLEQGFDVAARPSTGNGPLTLSLALSGNLDVRLERGLLLLRGRGVTLRYGGLLATDARGRMLHSWLGLVRGHVLIRVDDRGAAYPLRIDPFIQQAELTASDGAAEDKLGWSVAASDDTIVVGAPLHKVGSNVSQGAAYVFVMPALGWASATQSAELTASDGAAGDALGFSVAVSGDTIVVGAPGHTVDSDPGQGTAYVFVMPASGWAGSLTKTAELAASNGAEGEELGGSVAVSGDTIVVGAPFQPVGSHANQGAAYVFVMPASGWAGSLTQTAELTASDGAEGDELGYSGGVSGDTIVAGAPFQPVDSHANQGAAYVFVMPTSRWANTTQTAELTASDGAAGNGLGYSVGVSGDTIAAGAPGHKVDSNVGQGAAYVFVMPALGWASATQTAELTASDGAADDELGYSVGVSDDTVLAGAPFHRVAANAKQGAAYAFAMPTSGWAGSLTQTAELAASDGAAEDKLGWSVAASDDTVLAGAPFHRVGANALQGTAYAFVAPLPSIVIASPVNGATYTQGQTVAAGYACSAPAGVSVTACEGPIANGTAINTAALGPHTFTVNATDSEGLSASQSASYAVVAGPVVSGLSETAKTWREGNALAHITAKKNNKKKLPLGTTFSFSLNVPASVTFTFTEPAGGRTVGETCVTQTNKNKSKRHCTRTVIVGTLTFFAHTGANKVRFEGRISKHKKLEPGSYALLITATASGKHSTTGPLRFTIVLS